MFMTLADYEPGTTGADLAAMFGALRPALTELRAAVRDAEAPPVLEGIFDEGAQMKLTRQLAKTFGYDMSRGRVDKAVHPFSSGSGLDVRITTRTNALDPFNCFYSTIHEVGHAADPIGARRVDGRARKPKPDLRKPAWPQSRVYRLALWPDERRLWRFWRGRC